VHFTGRPGAECEIFDGGAQARRNRRDLQRSAAGLRRPPAARPA
jgi:hypothetical protein